jgi:hypothetical protein
MTEAEEFFNELLKEIPDVKPGKMFGSLCLKTPNGKSGAMLWHDNIVVKLEGGSFKAALGLNGSKVFEPMEGRAMKEWVQIPFIHKNQWKKFVLISSASVALIKKK